MLSPPQYIYEVGRTNVLIVVSDIDLNIKSLGYINYMEILYAVIFICIAIIYQIKIVKL